MKIILPYGTLTYKHTLHNHLKQSFVLSTYLNIIASLSCFIHLFSFQMCPNETLDSFLFLQFTFFPATQVTFKQGKEWETAGATVKLSLWAVSMWWGWISGHKWAKQHDTPTARGGLSSSVPFLLFLATTQKTCECWSCNSVYFLWSAIK